jgi:uncharacterized membrane protein YhiD involved in acid resistance
VGALVDGFGISHPSGDVSSASSRADPGRVGAERQWRQRAAGLRTNTLVCFGAAAFVDLGLTIAPGTTQVIACVVSGVGFLGAGAIMKDGGNVRGLNTAATLWCSAAVGACAGAIIQVILESANP